jgi:ferric-dicitrate binding protein FerR (iron transport regulator)
LRKYLNDDYSGEELEELLGYLKSKEDALYEEVTASLWQGISEEKKIEGKKADILVEKAINADSVRRKRRYLSVRWHQIAAAAVLALALGIGIRYLFSQREDRSPAVVHHLVKQYENDVKPGGTRAVLMAGQTQVVLNKKDTSFVLAGNTVNIQAGGVKVAGEKPVQYTLVTPKGGEYSLILEDGTKVWLNADSKLVYPSGFGGGARKVQLTGEAYFEVKTDAEHPFIVHTYRQDIRVLGTEFNVQAYPEENEIVTTLITGKVQVNSKGEKVQLKQGQQAISNKNGILRLQPKADLEQAIAWKEGYFRFDYTDIYEIMRQLSRWYDIKVSYEKGVKHREFLAFINRDNNISEVLGMLEATGAIRFEINGKKITVLNGVQ